MLPSRLNITALHQFNHLHPRRSSRLRRTLWRNFKMVSVKSCTRNCCREPNPGGTGCVDELLCVLFLLQMFSLFVDVLLSWLVSVFIPQLEDWWLNSAYLEARIPSQLYVNFAGPAPYLEHCWPPTEGTQLQRASISTWHTLQYWNMIRT